jgi:hypothetical protein
MRGGSESYKNQTVRSLISTRSAAALERINQSINQSIGTPSRKFATCMVKVCVLAVSGEIQREDIRSFTTNTQQGSGHSLCRCSLQRGCSLEPNLLPYVLQYSYCSRLAGGR